MENQVRRKRKIDDQLLDEEDFVAGVRLAVDWFVSFIGKENKDVPAWGSSDGSFFIFILIAIFICKDEDEDDGDDLEDDSDYHVGMDQRKIIPAALAIEGIAGDARAAFAVAAENGYRGIAFATNHAELNPEALGDSARRHLKSILGSKRLGIEALRAAGPRGGLTDAGSIDRTMDEARRAMALGARFGRDDGGDSCGPADRTTRNGGTRCAGSDGNFRVAGIGAAGGRSGIDAGHWRAEGATSVLQRVLKAVDFERARLNLETSAGHRGG